MKNKNVLLVSSIIIMLLLGTSVGHIIYEYKNIDIFEKIDYSELDELFEKNNDLFVYYYKTDCVPCSKFKEKINKNLDVDNTGLIGVNVNKSKNSDFIIDKYKLKVSPTLIHFKNGKEKNRIEGNVAEEELIAFLEKDD